MAHFQIFIPNKRGQSPELLEAVGCADLIAGAEFMDVAKGPGDKGGVMVAWRKPGTSRMGYQPEAQTWLPAVQCGDLQKGRYWVGFWIDSPPTPDDLRRPYAQSGHECQLGDGRNWLIPEASRLTSDMIRADDGSWAFVVQRSQHDYWLASLAWKARVAEWTEETQIEFGPVADFVEQSLKVNYRFTTEVGNYLRLINTRNVFEPLMCVVGAKFLYDVVSRLPQAESGGGRP